MKFWIFSICLGIFIQIIGILGLVQEMNKPKISFKPYANKGYYLGEDSVWRNEQGQEVEQLILPDGTIPLPNGTNPINTLPMGYKKEKGNG